MAFPGLERVMAAASDSVSPYESILDLEEEQEDDTERAGLFDPSADTDDLDEDAAAPLNHDYESYLNDISVEVSPKTDVTYRRCMKAFEVWLKSHKFIADNQTIFGEDLPASTPVWISAFIMENCDLTKPDGTPNSQPKSYSHAMKLRASLTYGFGRRYKRSNREWHFQVCGDQGTWEGNPSVSVQVARYMVSLRKRKYEAGDKYAMSSRAITSDNIRAMFAYNEAEGRTHIDDSPKRPTTGKGEALAWGTARQRLLVQAIVNIAFVCLMRADEVVKLKFEDIKFHDKDHIEITLPSRKTAQFGNVKPFHLMRFDEDEDDAALCPVLALAQWIKSRGPVPATGYIFVTPGKGGKSPPAMGNAISTSSFLELLRNNLLDIGIDPTMYGGHSLRRGGCQWLAAEQRWSITKICEWGGWSKDWNHSHIFKYLFSWNDNPHDPREGYWSKLNKKSKNKGRRQRACKACGRTCDCV